MPYIVKTKKSTFSLVPDGVYPAALVDVIDLGIQTGLYEPGPKVEMVFQLAETDEDFKRLVVSQRYNPSLNEKASLTPIVQALLGRPVTEEERYGLDLDSLIGSSCQLEVGSHESKKGGIFNHINSAMQLPRGTTPVAPDADYVRVGF